ncbi:MAG: hypothetical protein KJZ55_06875, partial [Flavobacteriales bacterium]|nr:hypothetical protein [Flavobacteriales bacterium]
MKFKLTTFIISILISCNFYSQVIFHQETFRGGTTGAGFSTGMGSGSGSFDIYIEPGSTIRKAWLMVQKQGFPPSIQIPINGINYVIDSSNSFIEYPRANGNTTCHKLGLHILDITNNINPLITNYNVTIPPNIIGNSACWWYSAVYIVVLYENNILPIHHAVVLINDEEIRDDISYFANNISPINTSYPIGFSIFSDRIGSPSINDGSLVYFNTNFLGVIGGSDAVNSSWSGAAVKGHFYYQNNQLFGLDDDTSDSLMNNTDGLANVNSYIVNNATSFNYRIKTQRVNDNTNWYNAWFLIYTPSPPCDTFTTTATTNQDTVCAGESIQLNATGGATYSWFSAFSTFNDSTLANPVATPSQTTTYIVTIKNDSGCVKTEHVKVWVNPTPKPDTITTSPQRCGSANGSIAVGNISKGTAPFTYTLTNLQTLATSNQQLATFNNLIAGNYQITITDSNNCQWQSDTLVVAEINDITVNFSVYTLPLVFPEPNP